MHALIHTHTHTHTHTHFVKVDLAKADIKAAKAEAKSQKKARQKIEKEISELAEAVSIERTQFTDRAREYEASKASLEEELKAVRLALMEAESLSKRDNGRFAVSISRCIITDSVFLFLAVAAFFCALPSLCAQ